MYRLKENILTSPKIKKAGPQYFVLYEDFEYTEKVDKEGQKLIETKEHQVGGFPKKEYAKMWIIDNLYLTN